MNPSRRTLVLAVPAGAVTLAACGGGGGDKAAPSPTSNSGAVLAKVADVPVGGAVAAELPDGKPAIVSQPEAGKLVAFSAICTHRGCTVAPAATNLACPCHGSTYDLATGKNTGGPAPSPLATIEVKVTGDQVVVV